MNIGITVYPTYGGSGIVGSELGKGTGRARPHSPLHLFLIADAAHRTERARAFS